MSTKEFRKWGSSLWADLCQGLGGPGLCLAIQAQMPGFAAFERSPEEVADEAVRARAQVPATGVQP